MAGTNRNCRARGIESGYSIAMLTLRQLEYLVTIADTGSFALAARVANVSQPTLSQ